MKNKKQKKKNLGMFGTKGHKYADYKVVVSEVVSELAASFNTLKRKNLDPFEIEESVSEDYKDYKVVVSEVVSELAAAFNMSQEKRLCEDKEKCAFQVK